MVLNSHLICDLFVSMKMDLFGKQGPEQTKQEVRSYL